MSYALKISYDPKTVLMRSHNIFFKDIICCDPSLEPSPRDGSNEGSQHMLSLRNIIKLSPNYPSYPTYQEHHLKKYMDYLTEDNAFDDYSVVW